MTVRKILLAAGTAVMALAAGAAHADTGSPAAVIVQPAAAETAPKASAEKRYCVRTTISGSRMPQKVCRTRKAWMAEGFDPAAPQN